MWTISLGLLGENLSSTIGGTAIAGLFTGFTSVNKVDIVGRTIITKEIPAGVSLPPDPDGQLGAKVSLEVLVTGR